MHLVFTKANADNGGRYINEAIEQFVRTHKNASLVDSLGQIRYLSAAMYADIVIGNSSSGLIEAPYLGTPTVNCGDRQAGRQRPSSVFDAELSKGSIIAAIEAALQFQEPYDQIFGTGNVSTKIISILKELPSYSVQKEFYDI